MREAGTVHIAELGDENDGGRLTGLFIAHWESDEGHALIEGPDGVSVDDAIAWGRERSDAVIVQVGYGYDGFYSAGDRDLTYDGSDEEDPVPILPWPAGGLRIAARPQQSALDGSEQDVLWRAHCRLQVDDDIWGVAAPRLLADDLVVRIEEPADPAHTADVIVHGPGVKAVFIALYRLIERTLLDLGVDRNRAHVDMRMGSPDERVFD
jgi:hypothetical protein